MESVKEIASQISLFIVPAWLAFWLGRRVFEMYTRAYSELPKTISQLQQETHENRTLLDRAETSERVLRELSTQTTRQISELNMQLHELTRAHELLAEDRDCFKANTAELKTEISNLRSEADQYLVDLNQARAAKEELEVELVKRQNELSSARSVNDRNIDEFKKLETRYEAVNTSHQRVVVDNESLRSHVCDLTKLLEQAKSENEQSKMRIAHVEKLNEEQHNEIVKFDQIIENGARSNAQQDQQITALKTKVESLQQALESSQAQQSRFKMSEAVESLDKSMSEQLNKWRIDFKQQLDDYGARVEATKALVVEEREAGRLERQQLMEQNQQYKLMLDDRQSALIKLAQEVNYFNEVVVPGKNAEILSLQSQIQAMSENIPDPEKHQIRVKMLEEQLANSDAHYHELANAAKNSAAELITVKQQFEEFKAAVDQQTREAIATSKAAIHEYRERIADLERQLNGGQVEADRMITELNAKLAAVNADYDAAVKQYVMATDDANKLRTQNQNLTTEINDLKHQVSETTELKNKLTQEAADLQASVARLTKQVLDDEEAIRDAKVVNSTELAQIQQFNHELMRESAKHAQNVADLKAREIELLNQIGQHTAVEAALKQSLVEHELKVEVLSNEITGLKTAASNANDTALAKVKSELFNTRAELELATMECVQLKASHTTVMSRLQSVMAEVAQLRQQVLDNELAALQNAKTVTPRFVDLLKDAPLQYSNTTESKPLTPALETSVDATPTTKTNPLVDAVVEAGKQYIWPLDISEAADLASHHSRQIPPDLATKDVQPVSTVEPEPVKQEMVRELTIEISPVGSESLDHVECVAEVVAEPTPPVEEVTEVMSEEEYARMIGAAPVVTLTDDNVHQNLYAVMQQEQIKAAERARLAELGQLSLEEQLKIMAEVIIKPEEIYTCKTTGVQYVVTFLLNNTPESRAQWGETIIAFRPFGNGARYVHGASLFGCLASEWANKFERYGTTKYYKEES